MYTKDKRTRVTVRLNENQFEFLKQNADILGVSPSEFIRMVVNASMATSEKVAKNLKERFDGRENDKTDSDDIV